jgi:hypothetical protein
LWRRSGWSGVRRTLRARSPEPERVGALLGASYQSDMEGPAVKWFLRWAGSSRSIEVPEGADTQEMMGRLRRRIRLIRAGCPERQSRMTVVRRELPPSKSASRLVPESERRIVKLARGLSCRARITCVSALLRKLSVTRGVSLPFQGHRVTPP